MTARDTPDALLLALQWAQAGLLHALHAVGLAPDVHGQPGWPFTRRLATQTLAIDAGLTRALALTIGAVLAALALAAIGVAWRRHPRVRWAAWAAAVALVIAAPWPPADIVLADADPTSFHHAPAPFEAAAIVHGLALYRANCAACHGAEGRADGPLAARLAVWPPRLDGALFERHAEGDVFWRVLHGVRDARGAETMPGTAGRLSNADAWAVIAAIQALAAGDGMQDDARWGAPVRAPDAAVHCDDGRADRPLAGFAGQRVRLVADGGAAAVREDPRVVTVWLSRGAAEPASAGGCRVVDAHAWDAYAQVSGVAPTALAGAQLIVDRDGWLRAFAKPGQGAWSRDDLVCRSKADAPAVAERPPSADGLGDLIAAIDADPIRGTAAGFAHAR